MLGGAWFEELFGSPEADTCASRVESAALKAVANHLGITQDPSLCNVLIQKVLDLLSVICLCHYFTSTSTHTLPPSPNASLLSLLILQDCIPQYHIGHQQKLGKSRIVPVWVD